MALIYATWMSLSEMITGQPSLTLKFIHQLAVLKQN